MPESCQRRVPSSLSAADEIWLQEWLNHALTAAVDGRSAPLQISHRRSPFSSSYACYVVTARYANGEELQFFLKDFGHSQIHKDTPEQRRNRELRVYRDLFADKDLGLAKYHGSVWDEAAGRFWLLVEYVTGLEVRSCDLEYWVAAIAWLGRFHGHFSQQSDRLRGCDFLIRHDAEFFLSKARLALHAVTEYSNAVAGRLAKIVDRYGPVVEVITQQPLTLVHGAYRPSNILVDRRTRPARICPVDWELASLGSGLYDLAFFTDGFEPPTLEHLIDVYRLEAGGQGACMADLSNLKHLLECFRLHRVLNWLSRAREKDFAEKDVVRLVALAEQVSKQVL